MLSLGSRLWKRPSRSSTSSNATELRGIEKAEGRVDDRARARARQGVNREEFAEYVMSKNTRAREYVIESRAWRALFDGQDTRSSAGAECTSLTPQQRKQLDKLRQREESMFTYNPPDAESLRHGSISSLSDHIGDLNDGITIFSKHYRETSALDVCADRALLLHIIARNAHLSSTFIDDPALTALLKQTVLSEHATGAEITDNENDCRKHVQAALEYVQKRLGSDDYASAMRAAVRDINAGRWRYEAASGESAATAS